MIKTARVSFNDNRLGKSNQHSKVYDFKTVLDLEKGDVVVCDTRNGLELAQVVEMVVYATSKSSKWIVSKVDLDNHKKLLKEEKELEQVKAKLETRRKELMELKEFERWADEDATMSKLFKDYESLIKR